MNKHFLNIIHKMVKILHNNLSSYLGNKGGALKLVKPKQEHLTSIRLLTLTVKSFFNEKNKRRVRKYLNSFMTEAVII